MTYTKWLDTVDNLMFKKIGLTTIMIPDYMWRALYDDDLTPAEAYDTWAEDDRYGMLAVY